MKYKKHITKALAGLFLSITIAELIIFWVHYEEAKYYIHHEIRPLLEEAMRKDINEKMKKEYFYYPKYENDPKKKNLGKSTLRLCSTQVLQELLVISPLDQCTSL